MDENTKQKRSEAQVEHSRRAARRHGLRSRQAQTGDTSLLAPAERSRRAELLQQTGDSSGLVEMLREKTADVALTTELAAAWLRDEIESVGLASALTSGMLSRYISLHNTLRLDISELDRLQTKENAGGGVTAEEVLRVQRSVLHMDDDDG